MLKSWLKMGIAGLALVTAVSAPACLPAAAQTPASTETAALAPEP